MKRYIPMTDIKQKDKSSIWTGELCCPGTDNVSALRSNEWWLQALVWHLIDPY